MSEIDLTETRTMARKAGRQVLGLHGDELVAFADTIVVVIEAIGMKLVGECAAATARAERAEAAEADLRATVGRVRALAVERQAGEFWYVRIADLLAALDAQRPAEGGPEDTKPCTFYEPGGCSGPCVGRYCAGNDGNLWTAADEGADSTTSPPSPEAPCLSCHTRSEIHTPSCRAARVSTVDRPEPATTPPSSPEGEGASMATSGPENADEPGQDPDVSAGQPPATGRADAGQPEEPMKLTFVAGGGIWDHGNVLQELADAERSVDGGQPRTPAPTRSGEEGR